MRRSDLGLYVQALSGTPLLSAEEERSLARRVQRGDWEARDRLIRANLRLVVAIAKHYLGRGVDLDDLIAQGNLGLMRAVEAFDPDRGVKFATYAAHWIGQSLKRGIDHQGPFIRIPSHLVDAIASWDRAEIHLRDRLGRLPTVQEVCQQERLNGRQARSILAARKLHRRRLRPELRGEEMTLENLIPDRPHPDPADIELRRRALAALNDLEPDAARVVRLHFGLADERLASVPLSEVARRLGLSFQRVRQLYRSALIQLRRQLAEIAS
jgi:RNA polymerase primary sigma factor